MQVVKGYVEVVVEVVEASAIRKLPRLCIESSTASTFIEASTTSMEASMKSYSAGLPMGVVEASTEASIGNGSFQAIPWNLPRKLPPLPWKFPSACMEVVEASTSTYFHYKTHNAADRRDVVVLSVGLRWSFNPIGVFTRRTVTPSPGACAL